MSTRDILDKNGTIIGQLELPDDTTEDQWAAALAPYAALKIIQDVTARQIRQALILYGVSLSQIDDTIASLPEPMKSLAQVEWVHSNMFQRERPLTIQVATMLGWTSDQLDALWNLAASL